MIFDKKQSVSKCDLVFINAIWNKEQYENITTMMENHYINTI